MIEIFLSTENEFEKIDTIEDGSWVNLVNPSKKEIDYVSTELNIDEDLIVAALDDEERSRTEIEDDDVLILAGVPVIYKEGTSKTYDTLPLGIIHTPRCIVTVCLEELIILDSFKKDKVRTFETFKKTRFILQILNKNAILYLQYLKQIDIRSTMVERELHKSMQNKELIQLLELEKSLVYFSTSLTGNEIVLEKLLKNEIIKKYEDDTDLLEDTIVENKQAIEMAKIYSDILAGTMDAFASIISNNLNIVMKWIALITIVMNIPTIVSGFYGMNVNGIPFSDHPNGFLIAIVVTLFFSFLTYLIMKILKLL